jgi:hypothetical protein
MCAFAVGAIANILEVANSLRLLERAPAVAIRPMGLVGLMFWIAFFSLVLGGPLSVMAFFKQAPGERWRAVAAFFVNLAPLPLGLITFHAIVDIRGLAPSP